MKIHRSYKWLIGATLVALLGGCGHPPVKSEPPPLDVTTVHPVRGEIVRSITLPGTIIAYFATTLYAKIPGYLKTIAVDKGDPARKGEILAHIEDPELLAELPRYEAELEVAEVNYRRLSEAMSKAPDLVVPLTVDEAKAQLDVAKANLKRIHDLLAYADVVAPFTGIITRRFVDPGAFIPAATSGSAAATSAVVTLMDFSRVRLDVAVPEIEAPFVTTSTRVAVTAAELPGRVFSGTVTRFEYALDPSTRTMIAEIEIPNPGMELRPGMYIKVKLGVERRKDALLVPLEAVIKEKSGAFVFTVKNNTAGKTPVTIGITDSTHAEIAGGLDSAEPVIIVGRQSITDGRPVNVSEAR
jgi:membrane fusion protein (multidrug efflux system)